LPQLQPEILFAVTECLKDSGVDTVDDLQPIEVRDLTGCLKPIQARKLIDAVKSMGKIHQ
jgi:hypothetical protein